MESKIRFFSEARLTLPIHSENMDAAEVIDAMKVHRIRLHQDQCLVDWEAKASATQLPDMGICLVPQGISGARRLPESAGL